MPRIRSIKPEFWTSAQNARVCRDARLLWMGMWNHSDDEGRIRIDLEELKMKIFPSSRDSDLTEDVIGWMLVQLHSTQRIELYESGGDVYASTPKFQGHQHPNKPQPSKLPEPSGIAPVAFLNHYGSIPVVVHRIEIKREVDDSGSTTEPVPNHYRSTPSGLEGRGEERRGEESAHPPKFVARETESETEDAVPVTPRFEFRLWSAWEELCGRPQGDRDAHCARLAKLEPACEARNRKDPVSVFVRAAKAFRADEGVHKKKLGLAVLCSQFGDWADRDEERPKPEDPERMARDQREREQAARMRAEARKPHEPPPASIGELLAGVRKAAGAA